MVIKKMRRLVALVNFHNWLKSEPAAGSIHPGKGFCIKTESVTIICPSMPGIMIRWESTSGSGLYLPTTVLFCPNQNKLWVSPII